MHKKVISWPIVLIHIVRLKILEKFRLGYHMVVLLCLLLGVDAVSNLSILLHNVVILHEENANARAYALILIRDVCIYLDNAIPMSNCVQNNTCGRFSCKQYRKQNADQTDCTNHTIQCGNDLRNNVHRALARIRAPTLSFIDPRGTGHNLPSEKHSIRIWVVMSLVSHVCAKKADHCNCFS